MSNIKPKQNQILYFRSEIERDGNAGKFLTEDQTNDRLKDTYVREKVNHNFLVLTFETEEEILNALNYARRLKLSIYPISMGHNWGYGTAYPARQGTCIIFDLSKMNHILAFDKVLGIITIEPGVTQGQLDEFLILNNADFMVPTTGAGPSCSLIGNILERGYGLTPIADHFQALLGIRALFADGSKYVSPFMQINGNDSSKLPVYRWGVGPYISGLFAQNGGAIVTSMTIQLAPRPEQVEMFCFWLNNDNYLERTVDAIRTLLTQSGLTIGGINLMSAERVSAIAGTDVINGSAWIGTGVFYGNKKLIKAGREIIKYALRKSMRRIIFINKNRLSMLGKFVKLPVVGAHIASTILPARLAYEILSGHPNKFGLPLAYSLNKENLSKIEIDPAHDECGLLWYAPIVPMRGENVRAYTQMVEKVCMQYGFKALITFSTISNSGFDSTIPLIFPYNKVDSDRAMACLRMLIIEGRALGFMPYRFHSMLMDEATEGAENHWQIAERIRASLDPDNLIAPGRYQRFSVE